MLRPLSIILAIIVIASLRAPAMAAHGFGPGYYECWETAEREGEYTTTFVQAFEVKPNGTYFPDALKSPPRNYDDDRTPHVVVSGTSIRFIGGPYDNDDVRNSTHISGTLYPGGVSMPHSQEHPETSYTLILRSAAGDAGFGPVRYENALRSINFPDLGRSSLWYCKKHGFSN